MRIIKEILSYLLIILCGYILIIIIALIFKN
jgi:hypothetical protein